MGDGPARDIETESIGVRMAMAMYTLLFCPIIAAYGSAVWKTILCGVSLHRERIPNARVTGTGFFISRVKGTLEI